jgi:ferrochelatase
VPVPSIQRVSFDALLLVGFGGPEGPDDVLPFLENVTRGRGIPRERLIEVGAHYAHFGGVSPINGQLRALKAGIEDELRRSGVRLPVYWGNRNWHPMLADTVRTMRDDGVTRALAFVTSAFGSYSGCRQYREDLERARAAVEGAPAITKLRNYFDHPLFVDAVTERTRAALATSAPGVRLVFTAHSIPTASAQTAPYEVQLRAIAAIVSERVGHGEHDLVFQSRSGAPSVPWLEPDVDAHLATLHARAVEDVLVVPIGFVSDHMEVVWDLDTQAKATAERLGMKLTRAGTVGTHPLFLRMVVELVSEQIEHGERRALTTLGDSTCRPGCCEAPARPARGAP